MSDKCCFGSDLMCVYVLFFIFSTIWSMDMYMKVFLLLLDSDGSDLVPTDGVH